MPWDCCDLKPQALDKLGREEFSHFLWVSLAVLKCSRLDLSKKFLTVRVVSPWCSPSERRGVQRKRRSALLKEVWDAVRKCSWLKQVLVNSLDTHAWGISRIHFHLPNTKVLCYPTALPHRFTRFYKVSALPLMISSCLSTPGQCLEKRNELCPFSKWKSVYLTTQTGLFIDTFLNAASKTKRKAKTSSEENIAFTLQKFFSV